MDRELLDLIADYVEARQRERTYSDVAGVPISPTADEIATRIVERLR